MARRGCHAAKTNGNSMCIVQPNYLVPTRLPGAILGFDLSRKYLVFSPGFPAEDRFFPLVEPCISAIAEFPVCFVEKLPREGLARVFGIPPIPTTYNGLHSGTAKTPRVFAGVF